MATVRTFAWADRSRSGEIRTLDLLVPNQARYQLRYAPSRPGVYRPPPGGAIADAQRPEAAGIIP